MFDSGERSVYPKLNNFGVMQAGYEEMEDGTLWTMIDLTPFWATGMSSTQPGARHAALYQGHKTDKSYYSSYVVPSPSRIRSPIRGV
jgi:hypothetical protein